MLSLLVGWSLAVQVAATDTRPHENNADTALRDSIADAVLRFSFLWGEAWRISEASRHRISLVAPPSAGQRDSVAYASREVVAACVIDLPTANGAGVVHASETARRGIAGQGGRGITSSKGMRHACPSWFIGDGAPPFDERTSLDTSLIDRARADVRRARTTLIETLDSAQRAAPHDPWLVGQLVRFLVDQEDSESASRVVERCAASRWWCDLLEGYVLGAHGKLGDAERVFNRAFAVMPADVRCRWNDHSTLVDSAGRKSYMALPCEEREAVNERMWWLADPLLTVPGNERSAEQSMRSVLLELRASVGRDERFDWRDEAGGDARRALVNRFGWPAYLYWPGYGHDIMRSKGLAEWRSALSEPITTFEYPRDRFHLVPTWRAITDPALSESGDWELSDPHTRASSAPFSGLGNVRRLARTLPPDWELVDDMRWWPVEHAASPYPLVQLPDGQLAFLRRQDHAILATALDLLPAELRRRPTDSVLAKLVVSEGPRSAVTIDQRSARVGGVLALRGPVPANARLAAVEFLAEGAVPAGRTRFGVVPPPALSALKPGETAVSAPVFLAAPSSGELPSAEPDSALASMLSNLSIARGTKLGVYWESYGFRGSDTVEVALWVERYTPQGIARRVGIAFRVRTDLNTPVVTQWLETQAPRNAFVIDGPVPIVSRSIVVDTSALPPGDYWLDVAVGRVGTPPARSRRGFVVR